MHQVAHPMHQAHRRRWVRWVRWSAVNATVSFGADLESTTAARRFAERTMTDWSVDGERFETARLLVSELVANAVTHAETDVTLQLDLSPERLRIEVRDGADGEPRARRPRHDDPTGRGLMIVEALADRWGVEPTPPGKTVWFELGS
jgi:anti-sigma regulatory factor (Ser/Thr protein kinase)